MWARRRFRVGPTIPGSNPQGSTIDARERAGPNVRGRFVAGAGRGRCRAKCPRAVRGRCRVEMSAGGSWPVPGQMSAGGSWPVPVAAGAGSNVRGRFVAGAGRGRCRVKCPRAVRGRCRSRPVPGQMSAGGSWPVPVRDRCRVEMSAGPRGSGLAGAATGFGPNVRGRFAGCAGRTAAEYRRRAERRQASEWLGRTPRRLGPGQALALGRLASLRPMRRFFSALNLSIIKTPLRWSFSCWIATARRPSASSSNGLPSVPGLARAPVRHA